MFCPNCATQRSGDQNFCRSCGLELGPIAGAMELHGPSRERARIEKRREQVERLGYFSMSIAGVIAIGLILAIAGYFKLMLFGPEVLLWSAVGALIGFVLLAAGFLGYSKFVLTSTFAGSKADALPPSANTNRLIADRPVADIPSVIEHSTDLLDRVPRKR